MKSTTTPLEVDELLPAFERHMHRSPVSEHTIRAYVRGADTFVKWLTTLQAKHSYDEVVTDDRVALHAAKDFRSYLLTHEKLAPKSVDSAMTSVGALYLMIGRQRPLIRSAAPKVRQRPDSLTPEQEVDVLRQAEARNLRDHALIRLLLASGVRVSEAASLDVDDVPTTERKGTVHVREGKGGNPRDIPLEVHTAIATLNQWKRERRDHYGMPAEAGPLWVGPGGKRLTDRALRNVVARVGEKAQVPMHPHTLRHTFCTRLADAGVGVMQIAALAGHSDPKTTMIYTTPREDDLRAAVRNLEVDY